MRHGPASLAALYVPAEQARQLPPSPPAPKPALQAHAALPGSLYELIGQAVHSTEPATGLYVPAAQSLQAPGCPVVPAVQMSRQSCCELLPLAEEVNSGHATHVTAELAPTSVE